MFFFWSVFFVVVFWILSLKQSNAYAVTIEEAYRAIPHRQTTYLQTNSSLSQEEAKAVESFFHLVDLAVVARVEALQVLRTSKGRVERQISDLKRLGQRLKEHQQPERLKNVMYLVGQAVLDQAHYLQATARQDRHKIHDLSASAVVKSASDKLHQAYSEILEIYPQESEKNKQAFFDHLCALDFL